MYQTMYERNNTVSIFHKGFEIQQCTYKHK